MATQKGRNWSSGDIVTAANLSSVERGVSAVSSLYEPTIWANGDTVTAAALNNIEQGIVNADFSTAQVTIDLTNLSNGEYTFNLDMPTIVNSPVGDIVVGHVGEAALTGLITIFNAVLNTNGCFATLNTLDVSVTVSGSISQTGEMGETTNYLITGDCTITISNDLSQ